MDQDNYDIRQTYRHWDTIVAKVIGEMLPIAAKKSADCIALTNFDPKDKTHLFVLSVAKMVGGIASKPVKVETSRFHLWLLNRKCDKDYRVSRTTNKEPITIDVARFLTKVGGFVPDMMVIEAIYNQYYAPKKVKKHE